MRSIKEELQALRPVDLVEPLPGPSGASLDGDPPASDWEAVAKSLGRLGRQQLRTSQQVELVTDDLREALKQAAAAQDALREQADDYRRRAQRLEDDARDTRLSAITILDALDDLAAIARQKADQAWLSRVERLTARTLEALAEMGLTEVAAADVGFDERTHEVVDSVERGTREPYQVIEVLQRGFRHQGTVLRRAQVITTR